MEKYFKLTKKESREIEIYLIELLTCTYRWPYKTRGAWNSFLSFYQKEVFDISLLDMDVKRNQKTLKHLRQMLLVNKMEDVI